MSVTGQFWRLTPSEWATVEPCLDSTPSASGYDGNERAFLDVLYEDEWLHNGRCLDIEKSWLLLDFLLQDDPASPARWAIQGGHDTPFADTDGKIRYLKPAEVAEVAAALDQESAEKLQARVDLAAINAAGLYPGDDDWDLDVIIHFITDYLPQLIAFYQAASCAEQHVILARS